MEEKYGKIIGRSSFERVHKLRYILNKAKNDHDKEMEEILQNLKELEEKQLLIQFHNYPYDNESFKKKEYGENTNSLDKLNNMINRVNDDNRYNFNENNSYEYNNYHYSNNKPYTNNYSNNNPYSNNYSNNSPPSFNNNSSGGHYSNKFYNNSPYSNKNFFNKPYFNNFSINKSNQFSIAGNNIIDNKNKFLRIKNNNDYYNGQQRDTKGIKRNKGYGNLNYNILK